MKVARYHSYGGPEVIKIEEIPDAEPSAGEMRIKTAGFGIIPFDWKQMKGTYAGGTPLAVPRIYSYEVSGFVDKLGEGVKGFEVGDPVFGWTAKGAAAEYAVLTPDKAAKAPASLELAEAAGLVVNGMTAWQALFDHAGLVAGQRVLIHAAAGGVGHMAVQLAHWAGAYVIGTASADNVHFIEELGADEAVDYHSTRFEDVVKDVDVVFDTIGGETQVHSMQTLKKGGILVSITSPPDKDAFANAGLRCAHFSMTPKADQLQRLSALVEDLKLNLVVTVELPFERIREAVEASMSGHAHGKIVVRL